MVRRQKVSKAQPGDFSATGRIAARDVTVSRVGDVGRLFGEFDTSNHAVVYEVLPTTGVESRVPIVGYLLPATFKVDGFDFDLTYDVGYVEDGRRRRYGVTRIIAGRPDPVGTLRVPAKAGVDIERVTEAALVRLALRASVVHGYAYRPGSVIDETTNEVVGSLNVGDDVPNGAVVVGIATKKGATPGGTTVVFGANVKVTALASRPVSRLTHRIDDEVEDADVRLLTGQRPPGRRRAEGIDDADLRLIARLYDAAYADPTVTDVPNAVRLRLIQETNGRLHYGESWIRKQGVAARRRGYLKQGKRRKRKGGK